MIDPELREIINQEFKEALAEYKGQAYKGLDRNQCRCFWSQGMKHKDYEDCVRHQEVITYNQMVLAWYDELRRPKPYARPLWQPSPYPEIPAIIRAYALPSQVDDVWKARTKAQKMITEQDVRDREAMENQERMANLEEWELVPELKTLQKPKK